MTMDQSLDDRIAEIYCEGWTAYCQGKECQPPPHHDALNVAARAYTRGWLDAQDLHLGRRPTGTSAD